jgi:hypothetical protein
MLFEFLDALFELRNALPKGSREGRQAARAEQEQHEQREQQILYQSISPVRSSKTG